MPSRRMSMATTPTDDAKKGKPVKLVNLSPVVTTMQTGGIPVNAPHPNAAKLYQLWMASKETQQFMSSVLGRTSTHPLIDNIPEVWDPAHAHICAAQSRQAADGITQVPHRVPAHLPYRRLIGG